NIMDSSSMLGEIVKPPPIVHEIVRLLFGNTGLLQGTALIANDHNGLLLKTFVGARLCKVDGKDATLRFLIECARKITNLLLKNYEKLDRNARARKTESILQRLSRSLD